jgi:hypothetical protein
VALLLAEALWLHSSIVSEGAGGSLQVVTPEGDRSDPMERDDGAVDLVTGGSGVSRSELDAGRRRFTWATLIAIGITAVPFIWILWWDWGPFQPLRQAIYQDNFYDLQARAMFHGHLSLPNGALGLEGFVHDGRTYTYFGLFPSIIRMPILLVTSSLDSKLTAPYMLLAWLLTGLFASLTLWRVRYLVRGDVAMGRAEATGFGVLMATLMGGTIWMLLAATPYVFNEDIAWSICLTVGSIFALLGVIERPSWGRVVASGVLIMCANLDRSTTGWACVVGAGLIALWFLLGLGGVENRRWFLPVLAAGLIPLVISCAVNYSKFGVLFGVSNFEQVWTHVNAYRRRFLAANHDAEEGIIFVPTNLVTYFRPDGLGFSRVFPYITLPASPPTAVGGVLFDRLYRTASIPASTPLLFLLSIWGLVTAFRPKAIGQVARTRLLLLASGSAGAALMLWGYIAPRYLGDFVPFFVLASAVAMADIFRRLEGRKRSVCIGSLAAIGVVALFGIVANIGMAVVPVPSEWDTTQVVNYVQAQKTLSDLTGHPLTSHVVRGDALPAWAPAGELYVVGNCSGMYVSTGENFWTVPTQEYERATWYTVDLGQPFERTYRVSVNAPAGGVPESISLVRAGDYTVTLKAAPTPEPGRVLLTFGVSHDGATAVSGTPIEVDAGSTHSVDIITDPETHEISAIIDGSMHLFTNLAGSPIRALPTSSLSQDAPSALSVKAEAPPWPSLCHSLVH